jgi:hypothetical protein
VFQRDRKFISHFYELRRAHENLSLSELAGLAVVLRLFLLDGFIHSANRLRKNPERLIFPIDVNQDTVTEQYIFLAGFRLAVEPIPNETVIRRLDINQFLSFAILKVGEKSFTVRQIIRILSNHLGNAHYEPEKVTGTGLDIFNERLFKAVVNSLCRICQSVAAACIPIQKELIYPMQVNSLGVWEVDDGRGQHLECRGNHWMEAKFPKAVEARNLCLVLSARFLPFKRAEASLISLQMKGNRYVELGTCWNGDVYLILKMGKTTRIEFETARGWGLIGRTGTIFAQMECFDDYIIGSLLFGAKGRIEYSSDFGASSTNQMIHPERLVFGADKDGKKGAFADVKDISIFTSDDTKAAKEYFDYQLAKHERT